MQKSLYDEALADVKKLKEIASEHATQVALEEITPKIKNIIESYMLGEVDDEEDKKEKEDEDDVLVDDKEEKGSMRGVSMPSEDGKIVVDLDALTSGNSGEPEAPIVGNPSNEPSMNANDKKRLVGDSDEDEEFELNAESLEILKPLIEKVSIIPDEKIELDVYKLQEKIDLFAAASPKIRKGPQYLVELKKIFLKLINTYKHIHESQKFSNKELYEGRLENCYKTLKEIKEFSEMSKAKKGKMNEEDLTLVVKGIPDDALNPDDLDVDIVFGAEDAEGGEDMDLGPAPEGEEAGEGEGEAMPDMGMAPGGEEEEVEEMVEFSNVSEDDKEGEDEEEVEEVVEGLEGLDDDTIVEIDEEVLRRAIKKLQEKKMEMPKAGKKAVTKASDFGGGHEEGEPFVDGDVSTADDVDLAETRKGAPKNGSSRALAEARAQNEKLRRELVEKNLTNAKLLYFNKLLQNEDLSSKQRKVAMERISEAVSLREVKLVYDSLTKALAGAGKKKMTEGRVLGSSSKAVSKSSPEEDEVMTEGADLSRWHTLAGIKESK